MIVEKFVVRVNMLVSENYEFFFVNLVSNSYFFVKLVRDSCFYRWLDLLNLVRKNYFFIKLASDYVIQFFYVKLIRNSDII